MSIFNRLKSIARTVGRDVAKEALNRVTSGAKQSRSSNRSRKSSPSRDPRPSRPTNTDVHLAGLPGAQDNPIVYDVGVYGLPTFEFSPDNDGDADPGEVVWTWVPYEEDPHQGKDRPVLAVAWAGDCLVFAQMTSKDHSRDKSEEDRWGRVWMDIGSGAWDSRGRESEVRLDRLLVVHKDRVRREGASLDKTKFTEVVRALTELHG